MTLPVLTWMRSEDITPLVELDAEKHLYLLELFCGPTFAFKDVALQFLGNLFEYFLVRRNKRKTGSDRYHLAVIGATSGGMIQENGRVDTTDMLQTPGRLRFMVCGGRRTFQYSFFILKGRSVRFRRRK